MSANWPTQCCAIRSGSRSLRWQPPQSRIQQSVYFVEKPNKVRLLRHLLRQEGVTRTLVFTKTKHGADKVVRMLEDSNFSADAIHANRSQSQRQRALTNFKSGRTSVLVATDIASRGIDVDSITHVINYDLPLEIDNYVHRIGRTARAGASGIAISFCSPEERGLLTSIERLIRQRLEQRHDLPAFASEPPRQAHSTGHADDRRANRGNDSLPQTAAVVQPPSLQRQWPARESLGSPTEQCPAPSGHSQR